MQFGSRVQEVRDGKLYALEEEHDTAELADLTADVCNFSDLCKICR
jgi:hypothetical protein